MRIWLTIVFILLVVACGDTEVPPETTQASPPPPATATPSRVPIATATLVVAQVVTPTPESPLPIQQYATRCGELVVLQDETYEQYRKADKVGTQEHWDWYVEWVDMALALRPPPELADFHEAVADFYSSEVEYGGPNSQTRAAFIRELATVEAMPDDLRELLLNEGCLDEDRLQAGRQNLEVIA